MEDMQELQLLHVQGGIGAAHLLCGQGLRCGVRMHFAMLRHEDAASALFDHPVMRQSPGHCRLLMACATFTMIMLRPACHVHCMLCCVNENSQSESNALISLGPEEGSCMPLFTFWNLMCLLQGQNTYQRLEGWRVTRHVARCTKQQGRGKAVPCLSFACKHCNCLSVFIEQQQSWLRLNE